jgi:hypothetical protein
MFQSVLIQNRPAQLLSVSGGWSTIRTEDGQERKVRNSLITPMTEQAQPAAAAAAAAATPARRIARVKDTEFDLSRYVVHDVKTMGGRRTVDCADAVAAALRGSPLDAVYQQAAVATGESVDALRARYGHLNLGMQRMNLGNRIRGAAKAATGDPH